MPYAAINSLELYYEIHGQGAPLMLIAGLASDSQSWQPVLEGLSKHHLVITPDNRGVGRSKPQEIELSVTQIADDCAELIRHLGLSKVFVLGHSMGGMSALDLASRYPDIVAKLILAGTSASNSSRNNSLFFNWAECRKAYMELELWFRNLFFWFFSERFFENDQAVDDAIRFAVEYPYPQTATAFANQVGALARYDGTDLVSKISAETHVMCGREDLLFPRDVCAQLSEIIPGATFSVINDAAHSLHWEQPQTFVESVLEFLASCHKASS